MQGDLLILSNVYTLENEDENMEKNIPISFYDDFYVEVQEIFDRT